MSEEVNTFDLVLGIVLLFTGVLALLMFAFDQHWYHLIGLFNMWLAWLILKDFDMGG